MLPRPQKPSQIKAAKSSARRQSRESDRDYAQPTARQPLPSALLQSVDVLEASRSLHEKAAGEGNVEPAPATLTPRDRASSQAVGARLKALRQASGLSQAAWCRFVEITAPAWHHYESGTNRISLNQALKVAEKAGVSLDWIYRQSGDLPGVPGEPIGRASDRRTALLADLRAIPKSSDLHPLAGEAAEELQRAWRLVRLASTEIERIKKLLDDNDPK